MAGQASSSAAAYPEPEHVLVQLSDTHLLAGGAPLYGKVDTVALLERAVERIRGLARRIDAIVVTGDVADRGEADAYDRVRRALEPLGRELDTDLVWVMGNHDLRSAFRRHLLDEAPSDEPVVSVRMVDGLRIVSLDSSVPGYHHGDLGERQREWLRGLLAQRAPHGTVLALHHPPLPTSVRLLRILELQHQDEFADVIAGSDVRAILAGHLHYPTTGLFAGTPVFVSGAVSYTIDAGAPERQLRGLDGGQSFNVVSLYPDRVTSALVPIEHGRTVALFDEDVLAPLERLDRAGQIEAYSRMRPLPEAAGESE